MKKKAEQGAGKALERLLDAFDEARSEDIEEAKQILKASGLNPDEEIRKGLEKVKNLEANFRKKENAKSKS